MHITENQLQFVQVAMTHPRIAEYIRDFWLLYNELREREELPEIEGNPHIETGFFKLIGYPFSVRTGHAEMIADIDSVIEKLEQDTMETVWMP